jgi:hypothetical protein
VLAKQAAWSGACPGSRRRPDRIALAKTEAVARKRFTATHLPAAARGLRLARARRPGSLGTAMMG